MKYIFNWPLLIGMGLFCLNLSAQDRALPINPELTIGQLENGLTYYIQKNRKPEKRVQLSLTVKTGSLQEEDDQLGIAHFVEHMAFNGTTHFAKNELIDYLESTGMRFGADLNAYTSFEETVYLLESRTDSLEYLEKSFLILEDWASGIQFDPEEVEKERGVVIAEWRSRLSPQQRMQQQSFPVLYKNSRYAERLPIGDPEIIKNISVDRIKQFYLDWYRPDLMAIIVVGDVDVAWVENEIKNRFAKLKTPKQAKERKKYTIDFHEEDRFAIMSDPEVPFTEIELIIQHPKKGINTIRGFRDQLLSTFYNRMLNFRMQEIQRVPNPPFTFAYSGYGPGLSNLANYTISAFVQEGQALSGLKAVLKATAQAQQHGFFESELNRQKEDIMNRLKQAVDEQDKLNSSSLLNQCISHFLKNTPLMSPRQSLYTHRALLQTIEVDDINGLSEKWITEKNRVFVVKGPKKKGITLPSKKELVKLVDEEMSAPTLPYEDKVLDVELLDKELEPQAIISENFIDTFGVTELELENGVKVVLKPTNFQNDQINFTSFSPGGHSRYPDSLYRSAEVAAFLVKQSGIGPLGFLDMEKYFAGRGLSVAPYIQDLYEGISGGGEVNELETMLQLVYLYFTQVTVDDRYFQSYLKSQSSILKNIYTNPYYKIAQEKQNINYDGNIRRQTATIEDLNKVSRAKAFDIYKDRFRNASDFTFVFVGNFDVEQIKPQLATYLGNLPSNNRIESWKNTQSELAKGYIDSTFYMGQADKSLVEIIYHGAMDYDKPNERYLFYSMATLLGERLRKELREESGSVYSVGVRPFLKQKPEPIYRLTISFGCDPNEVDILIDKVNQEIQKLKVSGINTQEVQRITEQQIQSRKLGLKENNFWLAQLNARYKAEVGLKGLLLENYEKVTESLSKEAIINTANVYLSKDNYIQLVLLPEDFNPNQSTK
ncbi:MAG: insulinase family protein [Bacteroidota bacterium]